MTALELIVAGIVACVTVDDLGAVRGAARAAARGMKGAISIVPPKWRIACRADAAAAGDVGGGARRRLQRLSSAGMAALSHGVMHRSALRMLSLSLPHDYLVLLSSPSLLHRRCIYPSSPSMVWIPSPPSPFARLRKAARRDVALKTFTSVCSSAYGVTLPARHALV